MEVSQSRLRTWRRCHKKHDYQYNQRLRKQRPAPPLLRGTILHEMMAARVYKKDPYEVLRNYGKKYKQLWVEERELYGENFLEDIDRVFEGYERAYADDPLEFLSVEDFVATDLGPDIRFVGYLDARVKDKQGRTWLMERKTHKSIPDDNVRFSDLQTVFYIWAWNRERPNTPIDGVIWDYLRTKPPTIPERLKNGQLSQAKNIDTDYYTYASELRRLKLDAAAYKETLERLKQQGTKKFFERVRLPNPPKEMIQSVVDDARQTAAEIKSLGTTLKDRNLNRNCSYDCEFYELCQAELRGLDAAFVRKTKYQTKERPEDNAHEAE